VSSELEFPSEPSSLERRHADLADVLERVLDKGIVIAGDITISLIDIELLTIKLRLLIASADKAREMGIDWWRHDPYLSSQARELAGSDGASSDDGDEQVQVLHQRLERLETILESIGSPQLQEAQGGEGAAQGQARPERDHGPRSG